MSEAKKPSTAEQQNADLVLVNTVSRLGCTVAQAREHIAKQAAKAGKSPAQAPKPAPNQSSKGESSDEALL